MSSNENFNWKGFDWRIGRSWGISHPDDNCYCDGSEVWVTNTNDLGLGIGYEPQPVQQSVNNQVIRKWQDWKVGYVSSVQTIKYGTLYVKFSLPFGPNLWPAIWLTDGKTWPPEIDIVEGWTGVARCSVWDRSGYRCNLFSSKLFPTLHTGISDKTHKIHVYKILGGTPVCKFKPEKVGECKLYWTPNQIEILYRNEGQDWYRAVYENRPGILEWFNRSSGMSIQLNNYITNAFTENDYTQVKTPFYIHDLSYWPY